jgi:hypothetical protein
VRERLSPGKPRTGSRDTRLVDVANSGDVELDQLRPASHMETPFQADDPDPLHSIHGRKRSQQAPRRLRTATPTVFS